jgi:hypothetical protein
LIIAIGFQILLLKFSSQIRVLSDVTLNLNNYDAIVSDTSLSQAERDAAGVLYQAVVDDNLTDINLGYDIFTDILQVIPLFLLYPIKNVFEVIYAYLLHK